jgi:hypothetical protein
MGTTSEMRRAVRGYLLIRMFLRPGLGPRNWWLAVPVSG